MYQPLVPCPSCRRHVRAVGVGCPFCGAAIGAVSPAADTTSRLSRGAMFMVAAAGVAIAGCSSDDTKPVTTTDGAVVDTGTMAAAYGVPADTGVMDTGGPVAAYGAPPDTGTLSDGSVDDTGGSGAKYGAPPPPADAGTD